MRAVRIFAGKVLALLLGMAMLGSLSLSVCAAASADLDFTQTGTITLTLKTGDGKTVSGGTVTLYQVAELYLDDGNMAYRFTSAFDGCDAVLDVEDTALPSVLAAYVREHAVSGVSAGVGDSGTVRFADLALGLYLVVQTGASNRYETFSPFVVTVPIEEGEDEETVWTYEVDASPKVGVVTPKKPPEHPDHPDDDDPEESTSSGTTVVVTYTLPQTGQLNWPVPILAAGGLLLLMLGRFFRRTEGKIA